MRTTPELAREFGHLVGRPERTYIAGESMVGHVTAALDRAVRRCTTAALPMCGVVGDVELFDCFLDYTVVALALAGIDAFPIPAQLAGPLRPRGQAGLVNTVVTNVPGPRQPLNFAGAQCLRRSEPARSSSGMGLINIVGSY